MIQVVSEDEARKLRERVSNPAERIQVFPELPHYGTWLKRVAHFASKNGQSIRLGVEEYQGDLKFFDIERHDLHSAIFMSALVPLEMVILGEDWMIGVSSYPDSEGSRKLEYSLRFYGAAHVLRQVVD
ncbi:hypothetical protein [Altericroceibacterium xinjiangense]|uniref:hypothetical protein n=1 Tax=Altericroceibacterium xinjiangense TaxID=762261 RepID=UPI000F7D6CE4|nr:hypothetical protein [Altericroceibacterium xinjiangense]